MSSLFIDSNQLYFLSTLMTIVVFKPFLNKIKLKIALEMDLYDQKK